MNLKAALIGACATSALLVAFSIGWGFLGVGTGVWIDGCPDVVAAYVETHGACPAWWKDVYLLVLPPVLCTAAACVGLLTYRRLSARPTRKMSLG